MKKLTITGVPEHFNYPWLQVIEKQPFLTKGIQLEWIDEPKGSGAMNKSLREGTTDLAIRHLLGKHPAAGRSGGQNQRPQGHYNP